MRETLAERDRQLLAGEVACNLTLESESDVQSDSSAGVGSSDTSV